MTTRKRQPAVEPNEPTVGTHDMGRGHDARVDEVSAKNATHRSKAKVGGRQSALAAPPPRDGYVQRWIRRTVRGEDDPMNLSRQFRRGWVPRPADTIPSDWKMFCTKSDSGEGIFAVNDLVLCEMPQQLYDELGEETREETRLQMYSVEHDLQNAQVAGGPRIVREHQSAVSHPARTVGRKVIAADNE